MLDMNPYAKFLEGKDAVKIMSATYASITKLVKGLTPRQLAKSPAPGKWSIQEIVAHLADCELVFSVRCRWIAFEDHPTLVPFDQDKWASGRVREKESFAQTLERFRVLREAELRFAKTLPKADLARTGRHLERGEVGLGETLETCAGHDVNHLQQIAALRQKLRA